MNRISDLVIDANRGIIYRIKNSADNSSYQMTEKDSIYDSLVSSTVVPSTDSGDDKELLVFSRDKVYILNWKKATEEIRYKELKVSELSLNGSGIDVLNNTYTSDVSDWDLLAERGRGRFLGPTPLVPEPSCIVSGSDLQETP